MTATKQEELLEFTKSSFGKHLCSIAHREIKQALNDKPSAYLNKSDDPKNLKFVTRTKKIYRVDPIEIKLLQLL